MKFIRQVPVAFISKFTIMLLLLSLSIWAWQKLHINEYFPINNIRIEGHYQHTSKDELKRIVVPYVSNGFFAVDVTELKMQILNLPWIETVTISRVWPDSLLLTINEYKARAIWDDKNLLDNNAVVFTPDEATIPTNLPHLSGPDGQQQQVLSLFEQMNKILSHLGLSVNNFAMSKRHAIQVQLDNGMQLLLGRNQPILRLERFARVYNKVFGSNGTAADRVDLRYPNGMAVHWKKNS